MHTLHMKTAESSCCTYTLTDPCRQHDGCVHRKRLLPGVVHYKHVLQHKKSILLHHECLLHTASVSYTARPFPIYNHEPPSSTRAKHLVFLMNAPTSMTKHSWKLPPPPTHLGPVAPKGEHVAAKGRLQLSLLEQVVLHHLRLSCRRR